MGSTAAYAKVYSLFKEYERTDNAEKRAELIENMKSEALGKNQSHVPQTAFVPYPELNESDFPQKLLKKHEFAQYRSVKDTSTCNTGAFQLSNTQKFLQNLISPYTEYNSILIMHGTGVGKTCSAISIAESFMDVYKKPALIICPPSLKFNFKNQIYNPSKGATQCTGTTYTGLADAEAVINSNYTFRGYITFASYIERLEQMLTKPAFNKRIRELYSDRVIIVDEVQNLRMVQNKNKGVSQRIIQVLQQTKGVKLVLLTATPLYNNVEELEFLMTLCYTNDKNAAAIERLKKANFLNGIDAGLDANDREILAAFSQRYVSYMRGENPYTFPHRLYPTKTIDFANLPSFDIAGQPIQPALRLKFTRLFASTMSPLQTLTFKAIQRSAHAPSPRVSVKTTRRSSMVTTFKSTGALNDSDGAHDDFELDDALEEEGENVMVQQYIEVSNITFPNIDADPQSAGLVGTNGFNTCVKTVKSTTGKFAYNEVVKREVGEIFSLDLIGQYSPKAHTIVTLALNAEGIVIIYSRFLHSGLLPIAFALEHAGVANFRGNLLNRGDGMDPGEKSAHAHKGTKYALIVGNNDISTGIDSIMKVVNKPENVDGDLIKIVLISVKAAEGFDFKYVRELHVLEPWYNLSRIEQVVGRGVRNCSHMALPPEKRNCTIYQHVAVLPGSMAGGAARRANVSVKNGTSSFKSIVDATKDGNLNIRAKPTKHERISVITDDPTETIEDRDRTASHKHVRVRTNDHTKPIDDPIVPGKTRTSLVEYGDPDVQARTRKHEHVRVRTNDHTKPIDDPIVSRKTRKIRASTPVSPNDFRANLTDKNTESIDVYTYRIAENKQMHISKIERVIKENAIDCHLNFDALVFPRNGIAPQKMINSQGETIDVVKGDNDFTRVCDYMKCDFRCAGASPDFAAQEDSTFNLFFIKKDIEEYSVEIAKVFGNKVVATYDEIEETMREKFIKFDEVILNHTLVHMVNKRSPVTYMSVPGSLTYKSNVFLFQPNDVDDPKLTVQERATINTRKRDSVEHLETTPNTATNSATSSVERMFSKLDGLRRVYGDVYDDGILTDYVVDHMKDKDLINVCVSSISDKRMAIFAKSLLDGGVIIPQGNKTIIFNYFTGGFHDENGEPFTQYIAKRLELEHAERMKDRIGPKKTFMSVRKGQTTFKMIYRILKDEHALSGVVCSAFPQLKNEKLLDMVKAVNKDGVVGRLNREQMCDAYELALRSKGMVARPVPALFYERFKRKSAEKKDLKRPN